MKVNLEKIIWREEPRATDPEAIREIVVSSDFFYREEIDVAIELVQERLNKGLSSGYHFLFAELDGAVIGYSCFGPIPCTSESYDIYWIAVHDNLRGSGFGRKILGRVEQKIQGMGAKRIYVETSSRDQYMPTRSFYVHCGFREEATLPDFYSPGDHKIIFLKVL
jgi:GNAT superfamily N-acetyltransferase